MTSLELLVHVLFDQVHRHVTGSLDHHLAIALPGDIRQFTQRFQLCKLRFIVRIAIEPGRKPSPSEKETSYRP